LQKVLKRDMGLCPQVYSCAAEIAFSRCELGCFALTLATINRKKSHTQHR
jgi:hypothetical protein